MNKGRAGALSSRRAQVANACQPCRISKVKCSGKHPTCARCSARGLECSYDVSEEGITKRQHLRQQYSEQRRELSSALGVLDVLRSGSDQEATMMLARLRLGQSVDQMYEDILSSKEEGPMEESRLGDGTSVEDGLSSPRSYGTSPSVGNGPEPNLNQKWPSSTSPRSERGDLSANQRMALLNIAASSSHVQFEHQHNQQQQRLATNEDRRVDWHAPTVPASQEDSSAVRQHPGQEDYGADHMITQRDFEDPQSIR